MIKIKASITIETAIVIPSVMIVVAVLILLMCFFHDESVMKAMAHEVLQEYCELIDATGQRYIYDNPVTLSKNIEEPNGIFLLGDVDLLQVHISEADCVLYKEVTIEMVLPITFFSYETILSINEKSIVTSGPEIIRLSEFIGDIRY